MKKTMRRVIVWIMAILMLGAMAVPALAAEFDFEAEIENFVPDYWNTHELEVGEVHVPSAAIWAEDDENCHSSNEDVVIVSGKGHVTAVSEGTAYVAIVKNNSWQIYRYDVVAEGAKANNNRNEAFSEVTNGILNQYRNTQKQVQNMTTIVMVVGILFVLFGIAEVIYIFISAPKCGMSRWWALLPVVSNVIGLIVFIVVRSGRKASASPNTVACPTCNGVHPAGTEVCNICGTKLQ